MWKIKVLRISKSDMEKVIKKGIEIEDNYEPFLVKEYDEIIKNPDGTREGWCLPEIWMRKEV